MTISKYLQFFTRELNKNKSTITKVFFAIFISLLIFSSVIILKSSIENEIKSNSRLLLGGDLELSKKNKPLNYNFLNKLKSDFFITEVVEFTSIIKTSNEENKTTRIRVIDNLYPLIGKVKVEPIDSLKILKNRQNTILIDKTTKNNLDLKLGDEIKIQDIPFEVIGIIESLPDIGGFFLFGDQALINKTSLKNLKINNLGSFINYKYKMKKKDNDLVIKDSIIKNEDFLIKYPKDLGQNLKKIIENFIYFLSIMSASSILISGIGLKNSLFSFLSSNKLKIAIYKSIGLSSQNIKILYYSQILIILSICSLLTYILGLTIISLFDSSLIKFLNIELKVKFKIYEYLTIQFFCFTLFFIFAKPVLDSIDQIKVSDLFRNSHTHLNLNYNRKSVIEISIFLLIFIFSFCILNVRPQQTAFFFCFFIAVSFFYFVLSKLYFLILNKIKDINNISIKMGIKNLNIFRDLNSVVIMTMGLGITILFFLGITSSNINHELNSSIPKNAPNYFFLGLQKNELSTFLKKIDEIDNEADEIIVPMIAARIVAINNRKPKEIINENNPSFWFINGERRISWLNDPPTNNPVVKGKWWSSDDKNNLKLSLDSKVANDLKLRIGDSITFNIYGNSVTGIIKNFRKVDYRDLNINFAILFNPKFASKLPHEFISTIKFNNEDVISLSDLLRALPNITYINLTESINKTKYFLNKIFTVSILISSVVILIGLIVVSNAVSVIGKLKVYQNLVLRILGFEKSNIIKLIIFESLILFLPITFFSLVFSLMFSYMFITNFLGINWYFSFLVPLTISVLFFLVLLTTLLVSNRKYLNFNAYFLLRNG